MTTDYQILLQKFNNFRTFIKSISSNQNVIKDYENMTENEFLLFGLGFLLPNKNKLDTIVEQISSKLSITNNEHKDKVKRYLNCFIEYLEQIENPQQALKSAVCDIVTDSQSKDIELAQKN